MLSVQDEDKFLVRTRDIAFMLCSTMSSEDTKQKFDFTDPAYCTMCEKFDPENAIMMDGEDKDVDTEESITPSGEESENDKDKDQNAAKDENIEKVDGAHKHKKMSREDKLKFLKGHFKDWLEYCVIEDKPIENLQVELEGET